MIILSAEIDKYSLYFDLKACGAPNPKCITLLCYKDLKHVSPINFSNK
jgi:hypothetical protein